MTKNWEEKLESGEYLRVKKIKGYHFAYARSQGAWGGKERYLGRCDPEGNIFDKKLPYRDRSCTRYFPEKD